MLVKVLLKNHLCVAGFYYHSPTTGVLPLFALLCSYHLLLLFGGSKYLYSSLFLQGRFLEVELSKLF